MKKAEETFLRSKPRARACAGRPLRARKREVDATETDLRLNCSLLLQKEGFFVVRE